MNLFKDFIDISLKKNICLINMTDEFFCVFLKSVKEKYNSGILVVVDSIYDANKMYNIMKNYENDVFLFPMDDFLTSEALAISPDLMIKRLETINSVVDKCNCIIITNLMGYLRFLPKKSVYIENIINLNVGDIIEPKSLSEKLYNLGYSIDTIVNKTGECAIRGFVIDVFPIDEEYPCRIEFFDNEIESIRFFDPETQMSIKKIENISIKPYSEFISNRDVLSEHFGKQKFLQLYEEPVNILSYFDNVITFFKDYDLLEKSYVNILNDISTYKNEKDSDFSYDYMFKLNSINVDFPVYFSSLNNYISSDKFNDFFDFNISSINNFNEDANRINEFINNSINENKTVIICLKKHQIRSLLKYLNMKIYETDFYNIKMHSVNIVESDSQQGFIYNDLIVLTVNELFNIKSTKKRYYTKFKYSSTINDINKLNIGDYVVHNVHGIGRYNGIKTLCLNDVVKDYLEVLYKGTDKIYIPVEKIDLISKYSARDGVEPKLNRLGGNDWNKTKSRVKAKINDLADKLMKLYAERESRRGFAFSKDCELSAEFENAFPYDLTKDQKTAIAQIKDDMEKPVPMDRLLCGDVGFGKTEVAFVAAFKAILDSKQVLLLCPTTILASQHYENALLRFKDFPVNIALLNRFTSSSDVKKVLKGLKDGTIDFIIGTHRLLSDDIYMRDLGLLIIDEEQRFGVVHKEKIKQYKVNVDVLTLTATPIPRTLQMSLVGMRSLSLITTPPVNRYPVQTYVIEESSSILKDAIYKELSRSGQVYILYNRVQLIDDFYNKIHNIVPDARIAIVHGQMTKNQLESTLYDFIKYEYDVLICTTIIETGIDIPNVNTLIIMDADKFGLSQLYQIRGRVGRSDKFAYAYLMYQPFKSLTENAIKRLNVIKQFTELGSGFSIATRDLSIRGAGDILGSEQAGFIDSVGIDLYLKMLNDEIRKRNNDENVIDNEDDSKPLINVTTHISDDYVVDDDLKIEIHKLINTIDNKNRFNGVKKELEDRFGKLNNDILVYMYEEWFEKIAKKIGLVNVLQNKNSIEMLFPRFLVEKMKIDDIFEVAFNITPSFRFVSRGTNLVIILDIIHLDKHPIYYLVELLNKINDNLNNSID